MKKKLAFALMLSVALAMTACGQNETAEAENNTEAETVLNQADTEKSEGVMTYEEYMAADLETEVTVETYVQAKQGWWENEGVGMATFYTQDADGAYFLYNMPCSQEEYDKLAIGTKIKVTGYKSEWEGEVEIIDSTFEIEEGGFEASAVDVTDKLGTDDIINYQNQLVSFKDMTVEAANDDGDAFMYNWDGSGSDGDDLYFNVSVNGETYTFTVESYLTGAGSDVYEAVKALNVGDTVDLTGFLYWYQGVNPHITSVTVK
ncbi:MAG: hypothetical protein K6F90_07850 [Lachnospiraceae bacterium]|nr:hypothetical protein [Lachnospiraceae bacterium]